MTDSSSDAPAPKRWELSREALDRLLEGLGPNREAGSLNYEALRARLIDLFAWEGEPEPEHLADETLNRLARRLLDGEAIRDLNHYALGIARLVTLEAARARQKHTSALREIQVLGSKTPGEPMGMHAMNRCLDTLPRENRELIQRYYSGDRAKLAKSLGISVNALRNRALRIRERLLDCMRRGRDDSPSSGHRE
jgi:DNA-directed RNA polymerase specialized sigma24 family protein